MNALNAMSISAAIGIDEPGKVVEEEIRRLSAGLAALGQHRLLGTPKLGHGGQNPPRLRDSAQAGPSQ